VKYQKGSNEAGRDYKAFGNGSDRDSPERMAGFNEQLCARNVAFVGGSDRTAPGTQNG